MTRLRFFKAVGRFVLGDVVMYVGECPFMLGADDGLEKWVGEWLILHPMADDTCTYRIVGFEHLGDGTHVGITVERS